MNVSVLRTRWAAVGAAVAITMGAGGIGVTNALTTSGEKPVYIPIEPCRLADLRPAPNTVGPRTTGLGPSETYTLDGWGAVGNCTLPANTAGLALNVTAVGATTLTNLRFFPTGTPVPLTANLNPSPGAPPTPNAVNVDLNGAGKFSVFNKFGTVAVVIDVMGYYDDHNHDDRYLQLGQRATAAFDGGDLNEPLGGTPEVVASVTVNHAVAGRVVLNSSATLFGNGGGLSAARCSITTGTAIDTAYEQVAYVDSTGIQRQTIAGTRGYNINKILLPVPDQRTYNLVCEGIGGNPVLRDANLTAVFVSDPSVGIIIAL